MAGVSEVAGGLGRPLGGVNVRRALGMDMCGCAQ